MILSLRDDSVRHGWPTCNNSEDNQAENNADQSKDEEENNWNQNYSNGDRDEYSENLIFS